MSKNLYLMSHLKLSRLGLQKLNFRIESGSWHISDNLEQLDKDSAHSFC